MARWRRSLGISAGLLALATLVGCGVQEGPGDTPTGKPVDVRAIEKGDVYVAMGDSYTAAPGNGPSTDDCLQTASNYPHKVAAKLGLKLKDVSCGGATTMAVTTPQTMRATRRPPQGDALTRDTDLVTISLGGGDIDALGIVAYACTAVRNQDPSGAPCELADQARGGSTVEMEIAAVEERFVGAIKQVAKRAPTARIVVIGYPEFFPKTGPCAQLPLALGDYAFAHRINVLLVTAQKRAAERANVEYVDVFAASRGHHMCAEDPWIAGLYPTRTDATPLHPYPEEQQVVANLIVDLLTGGAATPNREPPSDR